MPFKSKKQEKFLWANKPKVAKKFAREERMMSSDTDPVAKKALKNMKKKKGVEKDEKFKV